MERIHVAVRARPLSQEDAKTSPWRISSNFIFIPNQASKYEFDRIFGEDCKTTEVYEARTKEIVRAAVRGFNGTVFAYGQTNSGKTHTMRGSPTEPGVIPLSVHDLFHAIQQDADREFLLRMSYLEIYNEDINDLLAPEHRKLQIHENLERGIYVAGLREEIVASPQQVLDLMEFGESHRHIGETNMNLYSSRSHTIFRMIIESRETTEDRDSGNACDAVRVSVLNLVDLAGSERAAKTGAEGVRLKEGSHINKSLMTLGTVIKKLSEGAESQGGHVPYRDSKLTRILQPALGGNANTAIICNITLAQIHADETKSSLQFASRALRVTNCAHVNEILTDAALLKRQKKEIEELRAKLQGSRSDHLEEEILNLRNTLLQSELERERMALELEEEKKSQAEREKMLQEQAKKIKNLSSMVLYSNKDENRDHFKKEKRRDTWCPGKLSWESLLEMPSNVQSKDSALKPVKSERYMGPLVPFEALVNENEVEDDFSKQGDDSNDNALAESALPDPCALLHVTSRKKGLLRKRNSFVENNELVEMREEFEELLVKHEMQRTISEIQIDCLKRKLAEADFLHDGKHEEHATYHVNKNAIHGDKVVSLRESEAISVIKQLQEKINMLEREKSSSQKNLDSLVELATEQNICAREKFEELHAELLNAREEARVAREQLATNESMGRIDENYDSVIKLLLEVEEIMSEVHNSKVVVESVSSVLDEVLQGFSLFSSLFLEFESLIHQSTVQQKSIISNHEKLYFCMKRKVSEVENQKLLLQNQSVDLQNQIEGLRLEIQNHEASLMALSQKHELERSEFLSYIQSLEKEISGFSSSSLAKEKENLRKDMEKTKTKLKETESKLKNAIQEKTKLEGEKAFAEREVKRLHGQKTLLERDMSKRESLAGRRRDSVIDRTSKIFDPKKPKGSSVSLEQTMQEDYLKLEVLAFEMEATIASLEEELAAAHREKEEVISRNKDLASESETLSEKLDLSSAEINALQEEVSALRHRLVESCSEQQRMESSIKILLEEKEELAMQLSNSLLEMEEEKAIWSAKQKAWIEALEEKANLYNAEIMSLSTGITEARNKFESCREECEVLRERLACSDVDAKQEKKCSVKKSVEIDRLRNDLELTDAVSKQSQEALQSNLDVVTSELQQAQENVDILKNELSSLKNERENLLAHIRGLDNRPDLSNEFQALRSQLLIVTRERDNLASQIKEQQSHIDEVEFLKKHGNDMLLEAAKVQVDELTGRIAGMEAKIHNDEVSNSKEKAKLKMRLRGTQAQLDAFRHRYKQSIDDVGIMNRKFEEASAELKDRLASKHLEVLNLKKELAAVSGK